MCRMPPIGVAAVAWSQDFKSTMTHLAGREPWYEKWLVSWCHDTMTRLASLACRVEVGVAIGVGWDWAGVGFEAIVRP